MNPLLHGGNMYIILAYDVNIDRINVVRKILRKYLNWVQNSVFEGPITEANYERLVNEIKGCINEDEDSILIYKLRDKWFVKRDIIGLEKSTISNII